ncbi:hypothetical protein FB390_5388 [Nocardia bhagyanarayanae]|uniref:Uncharacterized protein n=1 Tax=Nocardia bhagyanarayanae TaxID=1215925 RepID=A0A543FII3_9NOCA|nr:hypothetical protein FB390_5388 [Nocardia bhagyanarayanae]
MHPSSACPMTGAVAVNESPRTTVVAPPDGAATAVAGRVAAEIAVRTATAEDLARRNLMVNPIAVRHKALQYCLAPAVVVSVERTTAPSPRARLALRRVRPEIPNSLVHGGARRGRAGARRLWSEFRSGACRIPGDRHEFRDECDADARSGSADRHRRRCARQRRPAGIRTAERGSSRAYCCPSSAAAHRAAHTATRASCRAAIAARPWFRATRRILTRDGRCVPSVARRAARRRNVVRVRSTLLPSPRRVRQVPSSDSVAVVSVEGGAPVRRWLARGRG